MGKLMPCILFLASRGAAERYPLGRLWRVNRFLCGCDSRFCALVRRVGRHSRGITRYLINKPTCKNLNRPFPFRPALIRGNRFWQPNTALQPTALSGRFHHFVVAWSFARFILFLLSRAAAERYPLGRSLCCKYSCSL